VITDLMARPEVRDELTRRQLLRQAGMDGATLSTSALRAGCERAETHERQGDEIARPDHDRFLRDAAEGA
jgi:hypothetical protein